MKSMHAKDSVPERLLRFVVPAAENLGGVCLLVLLLGICSNILLRPFGASFRGVVEISGYVCALAMGLCLARAQTTNSHITGGVWAQAVPRKLRRPLEAGIALFCAALLLLAGREIADIGMYAHVSGEKVEGFPFSFFAMALGMAGGLVLQAIVLLLPVIRQGGKTA